jgi:hypothetical protein
LAHAHEKYLEELQEKELCINNLRNILRLQLRETHIRQREVALIEFQIESGMDRHFFDELKFLMVFIPFLSILMALMWQKEASFTFHLFTVSF